MTKLHLQLPHFLLGITDHIQLYGNIYSNDHYIHNKQTRPTPTEEMDH